MLISAFLPVQVGVFAKNGIACAKHTRQYNLTATHQPAFDLCFDKAEPLGRICPYCSRNRPIFNHEYVIQKSDEPGRRFELLNLTADGCSGYDNPEVAAYFDTWEQYERWMAKLPFIHNDTSDATRKLWTQAIENRATPKFRESGYNNRASGPLGQRKPLMLIAPEEPIELEDYDLHAISENGPILQLNGHVAVVHDWDSLSIADLEKVYHLIAKMA